MAQINKPSDYFNTVTYTGTGATGNSQTVGFQPDWIWFKNRSVGDSHALFDSVRGRTKILLSDGTNADLTGTTDLESFDANGFTVGVPNSVSSPNRSGSSIVAWNWLAGGTASSNTDGSITSSVSANTTSGFSIVSYTGTGANATVGHGLGSALDFIIVKKRNGATSWCTTGTANGWNKSLFLDTTDSSGSYTFWQSTAPTSSVFSIDGSSAVNGSSDTFIAYCFAEKKGYSKFGSYTGNGSADGTFVYTGFKPAFVMVKITSTTNNWVIRDNKRPNFNPNNNALYPDLTAVEGTADGEIDLLSNGFKMRTSGGNINGSGTLIYMAFAQNPLVTSGGTPATAR